MKQTAQLFSQYNRNTKEKKIMDQHGFLIKYGRFKYKRGGFPSTPCANVNPVIFLWLNKKSVQERVSEVAKSSMLEESDLIVQFVRGIPNIYQLENESNEYEEISEEQFWNEVIRWENEDNMSNVTVKANQKKALLEKWNKRVGHKNEMGAKITKVRYIEDGSRARTLKVSIECKKSDKVFESWAQDADRVQFHPDIRQYENYAIKRKAAGFKVGGKRGRPRRRVKKKAVIKKATKKKVVKKVGNKNSQSSSKTKKSSKKKASKKKVIKKKARKK